MLNLDLYRVLKTYARGEISLFQLQDWITHRQEKWASLPKSDPEAHATASIMLAVYELDAGDRDEQSLREIVGDALRVLEAGQRV